MDVLLFFLVVILFVLAKTSAFLALAFYAGAYLAYYHEQKKACVKLLILGVIFTTLYLIQDFVNFL